MRIWSQTQVRFRHLSSFQAFGGQVPPFLIRVTYNHDGRKCTCNWLVAVAGPAAAATLKLKTKREIIVRRSYTQGEVTSRYLWPRYDRHFVGVRS